MPFGDRRLICQGWSLECIKARVQNGVREANVSRSGVIVSWSVNSVSLCNVDAGFLIPFGV